MTIPVSALGVALLALLLVILLVIVDTFTKWTAIAIRFCKDNNYEPTPKNILRAIFFRAWVKGYLESKKYKWHILTKFIAYSTVIFVASIIYMLFPNYSIQGFNIGELIALLLYVGVIFAELFSIAENLKVAGVERAELFDKVIEAGLQKIGVNYRVDSKVSSDLPTKVSKESEEKH